MDEDWHRNAAELYIATKQQLQMNLNLRLNKLIGEPFNPYLQQCRWSGDQIGTAGWTLKLKFLM